MLATLAGAGCSSGGAGDDIVQVAPPANAPTPPPTPPPTAEDPFLVSDIFNQGSGNRLLAAGLDNAGQPTDQSPDLQGDSYAFTSSSPDLQDAAYAIPAGLGLQEVNYIGAFEQDTSDNWTQDWTVQVNGNFTVWQPASAGTLAGAAPNANNSCPAGTTDEGNQILPAGISGQMDLCRLASRYDTDGQTITLTNDNIYLLGSGFPGTKIGNGDAADANAANDVNVTLIIEPGTLILGAVQEALVVTRGSQIQAIGTAADPIVFSSRDQFDDWINGSNGDSGRGEWAGLALMGYASTNQCGTPCDVNAEGNVGAYGGTNEADNSGELRYVVIAHAGNDIDGNGNELNGLTFFGTGSATRASYIQVHKGSDDGLEFFGSSTFVDHIVVTSTTDDSFDWGQGWTGGAQFVLLMQPADDADKLIEADNDSNNPLAAPISRPTLANFTMIGATGGDAASDGPLLRRGTGALIYNSIMTGLPTGGACLIVDGAATAANFGTTLTIANSVVHCPNGSNFEGAGTVTNAQVQTWFESGTNNRALNPNLLANGRPNPAADGATGRFVTTSYIGAFAQDTADNWTEGWTVGVNGNLTVWEPVPATPTADGVCPTGTTLISAQALPTAFGGQMDLCQLAARYGTSGETIALTNDNIYLLGSGFPGTLVGNGDAADGDVSNDGSVTLVVQPGTLILGGEQEALTITRGSQIEAVGTAEDPIVMTSRAQFDAWVAGSDGDSGRGEWAGLALMGYARSNECGSPCDVEAEGNIGSYGGTDDADSSGRLEYVVVAHAGNDIDGNGNELNAITFFGTGSGTEVSYVQAHKGLDDGIEFFGSSTFIDHAVISGAADDSLDWGQGWTGGAQFVFVRQFDDDAGYGIEADNDADTPDAGPVSEPTLVNMTIFATAAPTDEQIGVLLRRGTGAHIFNSIVTGADVCLDLDDDATFTRFEQDRIEINNSVMSCTTNFREL
jgi:hypothetical protein